MAGTNRSRKAVLGGPAVVLVSAQLGENIGTAARAMFNFGLTDLRLVRPRGGWPNVKALSAAAGADEVLANLSVFDSIEEAVRGLRHVYAATARERDMVKPVLTARGAARGMRSLQARGERSGILFGPERTGLKNDEVALADTVLTVPLNPAFASLNLAQAVLLVAYEWFQAANETPEVILPLKGKRSATKGELYDFFAHLERALDESGFFPTAKMRPAMVRNLRNMFERVELTEQDVRTLHGVVERLSRSGHLGWKGSA